MQAIGYVDQSDYEINDRNACFARAVAVALQIPLTEVIDLLKDLGRQKNKPTSYTVVRKTFESLGLTMNYGSGTIRRFCENNNKGKFILIVRGHALTVIDGEVYDWPHMIKQMRRIVLFYVPVP